MKYFKQYKILWNVQNCFFFFFFYLPFKKKNSLKTFWLYLYLFSKRPPVLHCYSSNYSMLENIEILFLSVMWKA